ncbi:cytochrome c oxidase subunit II [halophilic archaeon]|nr:cytochrome c oxidase subunit II [halophilic archaeon]
MDSKRPAFVALLGAALLALAVDPALAQGYDSATEELIQTLNTQLLYAAIPITVLVEGILIYTVWKYRNNEDPLPTKENRRLEITWTVATAIVLLFVGYASYGVMADPYVTTTQQDVESMSDDAVEIEVVGQRYSWRYTYTEQNITNRTTNVVVPTNRNIYFNVTSTDWLHSFHVPELGLKQDALPNQHNVIKTKINEEGTYQVYCAEYCGSGHSAMLSEIKVVSPQEYQQFLKENGGGGNAGGNSTSNNSTASA